MSISRWPISIARSGFTAAYLVLRSRSAKVRARRSFRRAAITTTSDSTAEGGHPPPRGTTGLFHAAILYPTRAALADALHRLIQAGIPLDGASDHGVSEALYLRDPDENGVELYWDRPKELWPRKDDGSLAMFTQRLDLDDLLRQREV